MGAKYTALLAKNIVQNIAFALFIDTKHAQSMHKAYTNPKNSVNQASAHVIHRFYEARLKVELVGA